MGFSKPSVIVYEQFFWAGGWLGQSSWTGICGDVWESYQAEDLGQRGCVLLCGSMNEAITVTRTGWCLALCRTMPGNLG